MTAPTFEEWAIVELMGHRRIAGKITEHQIAGHGFIRVDIPGDVPATQFYAPSSVYAITPVTEELARSVARGSSFAPVSRWELPAPKTDDASDEPNIDDSVKCCPDCERPNQFGELCDSCIAESQRDLEVR